LPPRYPYDRGRDWGRSAIKKTFTLPGTDAYQAAASNRNGKLKSLRFDSLTLSAQPAGGAGRGCRLLVEKWYLTYFLICGKRKYA